MRAPCTTEDPVSDRRPSGVGKSTDTWVRSRRRANGSYESFKLDYNKSLIHTHTSGFALILHTLTIPEEATGRLFWLFASRRQYWQAKKVEKNSHSFGVAKDNPTKPGCSRKILGTHSVPARGLCLHHSTSFYLASQVRLLRTNAPPVPAHRLRLRALPYLMSRCSCLYVVYGRYGAVIPARGLCLHHLQGGWRCGGRGRARRWWDTPAFCWAGSMPGGFGWRNRWSWPPPRL